MKTTDEIIRQYYSEDEILHLLNYWNNTHTISPTVYEIVRTALDKLNETTLNRLASSKNKSDNEKYNELLVAILNIQKDVIIEHIEGEIIHHKGDYVTDKNGNVKLVETPEGKKPQVYESDVRKDDKEKPLFPLNSPSAQEKFKKLIHEVVIPYDFDELREKFKNTTDAKRTKEIITKLFTDYYPISLTDDVLDRILVWFCNAKGKALGYHPHYGCVLAMVGKAGSGKSYLAEHLQSSYARLFKTPTVDSIEWASLFDKFNSVWEIRGLIPLNEVCAVNKADREVFKNRVSAKTITINNKHKQQYTVDNWTTLFSATNDKVLPLMGLQENRRIIEVVLSDSRDKSNHISDEEAERLFDELWTVCPISYDSVYGDSYNVFNKMLEDSNRGITEQLVDVAEAVFKRK